MTSVQSNTTQLEEAIRKASNTKELDISNIYITNERNSLVLKASSQLVDTHGNIWNK